MGGLIDLTDPAVYAAIRRCVVATLASPGVRRWLRSCRGRRRGRLMLEADDLAQDVALTLLTRPRSSIEECVRDVLAASVADSHAEAHPHPGETMMDKMMITTMDNGVEATVQAPTLGELAARLAAVGEWLRARCVPVPTLDAEPTEAAPGEAGINASDPTGLRATR